MSGDAELLLRAVLAAPHDDAPRLILADWLDEHGDHDRAQFIRVQCELAGLPGDPDVPHPLDDLAALERKRLLRWRERELLERNWNWWAKPLPATYLINAHPDQEGAFGVGFRRGFIDEVRMPLAAFVGGPCGRCRERDQIPNVGDGAPLPTCPDCSGTGRVEGLAGRLFAAHPITKVVLAGREPAASVRHGGWFRWWSAADEDDGAVIGAELYQRIRELEWANSVSGHQPYFPSRAAAHAALSAACVRWGRSRVPWLRAADAGVSGRG